MEQQPVRILIVDDDEQLLRLLESLVGKLGYHGTGFLRARDALEAFELDPGSYRVLITDMSLAEIGGEELGMRMMRAAPELRVIFCSGYPFDVDSLPEGFRERAAFVHKPFSPRELTETVKRLFDQ
jgi:DNA-binding NtrC family response regulator